jgi:hypothetical protein
MAALEASVKEAKAARGRHPAVPAEKKAEDKPAPAKKRTRKSA